MPSRSGFPETPAAALPAETGRISSLRTAASPDRRGPDSHPPGSPRRSSPNSSLAIDRFPASGPLSQSHVHLGVLALVKFEIDNLPRFGLLSRLLLRNHQRCYPR